jgi:RNA polymerase sigma-70 factor (ECF subfamily)
VAIPAEFVQAGSIAIAQPAEDQLELLVREHARLVYRIAFSVLRNPHDAEDAVQEVFVRVLRSRHRLREVTDLKAYVARTAWNVSLDSRRRHKEVPIDVGSADEGATAPVIRELQASGASLEQIASDRQIMEFVEKAIAELPPDLRDAIRLATVEELSAAEAGKILGVAEATVRTRVFRARQILREKLGTILEKHHA